MLRNGSGYGRRRHSSELIFGMHLSGTEIWYVRGAVYSVIIRTRALLCFVIRLGHCVLDGPEVGGPITGCPEGELVTDARPHGVRTSGFGMFGIWTYVNDSRSQSH